MGNYETQFFCVNSRFHATTCRGLAFKILHIYCCAEMKFPGRLHSSKVSKFCRQCIFQHLVKVLDPANLYHWWLWYMELFRDEMFCSVLITLFQHFFPVSLSTKWPQRTFGSWKLARYGKNSLTKLLFTFFKESPS